MGWEVLEPIAKKTLYSYRWLGRVGIAKDPTHRRYTDQSIDNCGHFHLSRPAAVICSEKLAKKLNKETL